MIRIYTADNTSDSLGHSHSRHEARIHIWAPVTRRSVCAQADTIQIRRKRKTIFSGLTLTVIIPLGTCDDRVRLGLEQK
jgi:hypothetical protein